MRFIACVNYTHQNPERVERITSYTVHILHIECTVLRYTVVSESRVVLFVVVVAEAVAVILLLLLLLAALARTKRISHTQHIHALRRRQCYALKQSKQGAFIKRVRAKHGFGCIYTMHTHTNTQARIYHIIYRSSRVYTMR